MPESKKPEGWRAFDQLAKKLVQVPKEQVDAKVAKDKGPPNIITISSVRRE